MLNTFGRLALVTFMAGIVALSPAGLNNAVGEGTTPKSVTVASTVARQIPLCASCTAVVTPYGSTGIWLGAYSNTEDECDLEQCYVCIEEVCWTGSDGDLFLENYLAWEWIVEQSGCPRCSDSRALLALEEGIDEESVAELARLILESDGTIWLNEERHAIQVRGCGTTVGFHYPLSENVFIGISNAMLDVAR